VNPTAVGKALVWTQGSRCDVEVATEEEQAHGVDPTTIGKAIGEAPAWTRRWWRIRAGAQVVVK
jgi:hypothetical protein